MPYITRDKDKKIIASYSIPQYEGQEYLADDSEEFAGYLNTQDVVAEQEALIRAKTRELAIAALVKEGKL